MKKILRIEIVNPELSEAFTNGDEYRGILFGYNKKSDKQRLVLMFCEGILNYLETRTESAAFLGSLIISASESIQQNDPEIAALVRKTVIEHLKNIKK